MRILRDVNCNAIATCDVVRENIDTLIEEVATVYSYLEYMDKNRSDNFEKFFDLLRTILDEIAVENK